MNMSRTTLALAVVAAAGFSTSELRAQEYTLPPAPTSSAKSGFRAESGPCFYNAYSWQAVGALNNTALGGEILAMLDWNNGGAGSSGGGCSGTYGLTSFDFVGPWGYQFMDGQANATKAPYVSPAEVQRIKKLSLAAAEAGSASAPLPDDVTPPHEPGTRTAHAPVPRIGEGYGSNALISRSLVLKVAPEQQPATYDGIPIVERDRSWERIETTSGRRVWRQSVPGDNSYDSRAGVGRRYSSSEWANARSPASAADMRVRRQERMRAPPRPAFSRPPSPSRSYSPSAAASRTKSAPRGAGKKVEQ